MKTFTDSAGRKWELSLTIGSVKRIKSILGLDLLNLEVGDPPPLVRLSTDIMLLCDVLYVLVEPKATELGVNDVDFGAALGGTAIDDGMQALHAEIVDFFRLLHRPAQAAAVEKQAVILGLAQTRGAERIEKLDVDKLVTKAMAGGEPSTSSVE